MFFKKIIVFCVVGLMLLPTGLAASSRTPGKVIAGFVEKITMLPSGITVAAKLDTGALTSSIHAEEIIRFKKGNEKWVRFTLVLQDSQDKKHRIPMERPLVRRIKVKEDDDQYDRRVTVDLPFCFDGRSVQAQFSLNNRSNYLYPVLLGRRFLEGVAIVDPALSFQTQRNCNMPHPSLAPRQAKKKS